ncbi:MAG: site-2 protease family protein [Candidatus Promineifilaceae bacterium]|nr:site-2 protease family protein [Candidatus Promineifilaceae bacterium]
MFNRAPSQAINLESIEALRMATADLFALTDTTMDWPQPGHVRFRGYFLCDLADCYDELRRRFERIGFTPIIRQDGEAVAVIAQPVVYDPPGSNWIINLVLFLATVASTLFVGSINEVQGVDALINGLPGSLLEGLPFSFSLLLILGAHELGHYFAARYHDVPVTLPYFIPFPSIIGTMGAFIRLKAPIKNRRALLDIGAAGPLAGMVFAVPVLIIGLLTSPVSPTSGSYIQEGNSILYGLAKLLIYGQWLPNNGLDVHLNQVAWAGWVGLFVTGLNLIPVGQLDGGHVAYVLFGQKARRFFWPAIFGLIALAVLAGTATWWVWVALLFFFGRSYAEPLDDVTRLDPQRRWIAIFTLILFFLVFVPTPLTIVSP